MSTLHVYFLNATDVPTELSLNEETLRLAQKSEPEPDFNELIDLNGRYARSASEKQSITKSAQTQPVESEEPARDGHIFQFAPSSTSDADPTMDAESVLLHDGGAIASATANARGSDDVLGPDVVDAAGLERMDRDFKVKAMRDRTGLDEEQCQYYLESYSWNLESAVAEGKRCMESSWPTGN